MHLVSTVIITRNEESNLRRSLPRLTWCDEIIVVDSGSTDKTIEVAKAFGCSIYYRKFDGYGKQKQFAVSLARNKWVLCVDADEVLCDELVREIRNEMLNPSADGYLIPRTFIFKGREFRHGKEAWNYVLRLFNKEAGNFNDSKVHEKVILTGKQKRLKNNMLHYSYRNNEQYFSKLNKYSSYSAEMAFRQGKHRSLISVIFAIPVNFIKYYFVERNIFNGPNGFYWSVLHAVYHFLKYMKIREMHSTAHKLHVSARSNLPTIDPEPHYEDQTAAR